jgi:predicted ATPase
VVQRAGRGRPSGELVGRARELDELEAVLDRLAAGEPWIVQVVGEPGIGKSRLVSELAGRAERRGYLVLGGRAAEFERDVPFGLIVEALNDYLGGLDAALLRTSAAAPASRARQGRAR